MDEGLIGLLILIGISVVIALAAHTVIKNYYLALLVAGPTSSLLFCIASWFHEPDPFIVIAFFTGSFIATGIAWAIGLPFLVKRHPLK